MDQASNCGIDFATRLRLREGDGERLRLLGEVGYLALYLGDLDAADDVFTAVTVMAAEEPVGHLGLAEVELSRGRPECAEQRAAQAACCRHVDADKAAWANTLRARALRELRREDEAQRIAAAVEEIAPGGAAAAAQRLRREIDDVHRSLAAEHAAVTAAGRRAPGSQQQGVER